MSLTHVSQSRRQHGHRIADAQFAGLDAAHEAAIVVQLGVGRILWAADVLHREAEFFGVLAVHRRRAFEDFEQRRPVVPVQVLAAIHHHVAVQCRHRYEAHVGDAQLVGERQIIRLDAREGFGRVVREVHLVHRHDDLRNAQQVGQVGMAAGLGEHALAGVDQDDRQVGGRRGGDHVARVLLVARRVGDDVLACSGGEIAIGDVDGDPLFALGLQAVGQQRQVDDIQPTPFRSSFHRMQGIDEDRLAVKQQATNQGALAVVDAAAGQKTQQAIVGEGFGRESFDRGHQK